MITGGLGFLGSSFVRAAARNHDVVVVDAETYAGDIERLEDSRAELDRLDIADPTASDRISQLAPDAIVHFAAESHVTRSEAEPERFYRTNVRGTQTVIEAAQRSGARLIHISTDEVYGPCLGKPFKEEDKKKGSDEATSAYAKSKALADDLVRQAEDLDAVVARLTNCFGKWQHPEKAIARWTIKALQGLPLPVWGSGLQRRAWMSVEDAVAAILLLMKHGESGAVYNAGPSDGEITNVEVASLIARLAGQSDQLVFLSNYDRPDHDPRYAVDAQRLCALGWRCQTQLEDGLRSTVEWYRNHSSWWEPQLAASEALYDDQAPREGLPVE